MSCLGTKPHVVNVIMIKFRGYGVSRVMMFNATFNKMSVVSWWSVLLVEETGVS